MHGIDIQPKSYCKNKAMPGRFIAESRVLEICPLGSHGQTQLLETLNHEAVHAVQNCIGRRLGLPFLSIKEAVEKSGNYNLSKELGEAVAAKLVENRKIFHVIDVTHHENRMTEAEAYALEDETWTVISLLNDICGPANSLK
jgi:hypothetical protein